jgi:hypothetical protein
MCPPGHEREGGGTPVKLPSGIRKTKFCQTLICLIVRHKQARRMLDEDGSCGLRQQGALTPPETELHLGAVAEPRRVLD